MDPKEVWQTALGELEVTLSKANFTTWFKDTFILSITEDEIIIGVPNAFTNEWLQNKYHPQISETLKKILPKIKKITYKVSSKIQAPKPAQSISSTEKKVIRRISHPQLNSKYHFNNFIVGKSNRLAAATAQAISSKPGTVYNPLFLYGGVGLGKTHLIQAIGNDILEKSPKKKVIYVSCERFTNDFIQSISNGQINNFKKAYRDIDVLLVDDIQFLGGKEGTQEEFFHTFNTLHQDNRQIVMTSDRIPQAIPLVQERLTSRFGWGMVADIQAPDLELRQAILRSKCQERKFLLEDDIIDYVASAIESNIRELEGSVIRIMTYCQLNKVVPSLDVVSKILQDVINSKGKNLSVDGILKTVGQFFKIAPEELKSPKRNKELVWPRQIAMYLLRHEMNLSFPKISRELNKKDHTTIMHGVNKIEKEIGINNSLKQELSLIKDKLHTA